MIAATGSPPRLVADGLGMVESARWYRGQAWFADWTNGRIHRVEVGSSSGPVQVAAEVASLPLCFDFIGDELMVLDSAAGRVLRGPVGGELASWADVSPVGRVGNEIVALPDGGCYLNFGNFDPSKGFPTTPSGTVVHVDPHGVATVVAEGLAFPNGMAVSVDGSTLIVAESHAGRLTAFSIGADGSLTDRRVWAEIAGSAPDGISLTPSGDCWFADVPNQQAVCVSEGGREPVRVIDLDRGGFSCAVSPDATRLLVVGAVWADGAGMTDPDHDWDGIAWVFDL